MGAESAEPASTPTGAVFLSYASQDAEAGAGNARVLRNYGDFAVHMGRGDSGLTAVRRAVVLDPLNSNAQSAVGETLQALRHYPEAIAAFKDAEALPSTTPGYSSGSIGTTYYLLGDFANARATCEQHRDNTGSRDSPGSQFCLALVYDKLGRHADAEAELKHVQTTSGDAGAYRYAEIYAQWAIARRRSNGSTPQCAGAPPT